MLLLCLCLLKKKKKKKKRVFEMFRQRFLLLAQTAALETSLSGLS